MDVEDGELTMSVPTCEVIYARYQVGTNDETIEQIYEMPTQGINMTLHTPDYVVNIWKYQIAASIKL